MNAMDSQQQVAGWIGLGISLSLWFLCSWRLLFHFQGRSDQSNSPSTMSRPLTLRQRFHLLLWLATTSEAVGYADLAGLPPFVESVMSNDLAEKLSYILLDLLGRSVFEFLSFTCVTELWMQTALRASPTTSSYMELSLLLRTLNRVLGAISVLLSATLCAILLFDPKHDLYIVERSDLIFRLQLLMEALCWGVAAVLVWLAAKITAERIQQNFETFPPADNQERWKLQGTTLGPMAICAICYIVRSIFLACRLVSHNIWVATTRLHPAWWIFFVWTPTLLVVTVALFSARRRDRLSSDNRPSSQALDGENDYTEPLLSPSIPPPAEAFQNFRRFSAGIISPFGKSDNGAPSTPSSFVPPSPDRASTDAASNYGDLTEM